MSSEQPLQYGEVTSTYFWDDGSGINGDTGQPASGKDMQEGMAASPSWPLGTEGYVIYDGKKEDFFVGDRGPGEPAEDCQSLLDLDGITFAKLTGESWNDESLTVSGGNGHIDVEYVITKWGDGAGNEGVPHPMSESQMCNDAVAPLPDRLNPEVQEKKEQEQKEQEAAEQKKAEQEQAVKESNGQQKADQTDAELAASDSGGPGDGTATGTESTVANNMSGAELAGAELPSAVGALTLAILPALAIAAVVARRRPAPSYAEAASDGENGPLARLGDRFAQAKDNLAEKWSIRGRHGRQ